MPIELARMLPGFVFGLAGAGALLWLIARNVSRTGRKRHD